MELDGINGVAAETSRRVRIAVESLILELVKDSELDQVPSQELAARVVDGVEKCLKYAVTQKNTQAYIEIHRK